MKAERRKAMEKGREMVETTVFYRIKDENNVPVVTVCLLRMRPDAPVGYARGITVLHDLDRKNQNARLAMKIAEDRALLAAGMVKSPDDVLEVRSERMFSHPAALKKLYKAFTDEEYATRGWIYYGSVGAAFVNQNVLNRHEVHLLAKMDQTKAPARKFAL